MFASFFAASQRFICQSKGGEFQLAMQRIPWPSWQVSYQASCPLPPPPKFQFERLKIPYVNSLFSIELYIFTIKFRK